jgi:hypothetical protein
MALVSRAARLAVVLAASASGVGACAADAGDAPKGDVPPSGEDGAALDQGADPFEASNEGSRVDTSVPFADGSGGGDAVGETAFEASSVEAAPGGDAAGAPDGGGVDALPDVTACPTCPLVVEYATTTAAASSQEIRPHLDIVNHGTSAQDLASLTVRYWYTADGSASQAYACDYTALAGGCGALSAQFVAMPQAKATADHYMEVAFASGSIAPGSHAGEMQLRFHDTAYAVTFTQANDWSFDGSKSAYAPWTNVTLYRSGTLVWGTEPP